jgi:hypothetical protein
MQQPEGDWYKPGPKIAEFHDSRARKTSDPEGAGLKVEGCFLLQSHHGSRVQGALAGQLLTESSPWRLDRHV